MATTKSFLCFSCCDTQSPDTELSNQAPNPKYKQLLNITEYKQLLNKSAKRCNFPVLPLALLVHAGRDREEPKTLHSPRGSRMQARLCSLCSAAGSSLLLFIPSPVSAAGAGSS